MQNGIIIVDHGSRRTQSNEMLEAVAELFAQRFHERYAIVEPAHMELAEPSIASAYAKCVERGATRVIVCPFFLGPGKHWTSDIPRLTAEAAAAFPQTRYHVTQTLGIDDLILDLLAKRVGHCEQHAFDCEACRGTLRSGEPGITIAGSEEKPHAAANGQCASCPFLVHPDGSITDKRRVVPAV
jgi:sirohydrochlorin ferrochelatase